MDRRDFLKIMAGVPIVIGLPRGVALGRDDEAKGCAGPPRDGLPAGARAIGEAVAAARRAGRPVLIVAVPPLAHQGDEYARRQRTARHLAEMLESDDTRTRLLLAHLSIVIAQAAELRAAVALADADAATTSGVWLLDGACGGSDGSGTLKPSERLKVALDGTDEEAARLLPALRERIFGGDDLARLKARAATEREALDDATRAEVDAALADIAVASFEARERGTAVLEKRRDAILSTLALLALTSKDPEVATRCAGIAGPEARPRVLGAEWAEFHGGCGLTDPYSDEMRLVGCGRAARSGPAKIYLRLLAR